MLFLKKSASKTQTTDILHIKQTNNFQNKTTITKRDLVILIIISKNEIMKKIICLLTIATIIKFSFGQTFNLVVFDEKAGKEVSKGWCNIEGIKKTVWSEIYDLKYNSYNIDYNNFAELANSLQNTEILIVLSTWCGDSKDWVPPFIKILDQISYDKTKLRILALDRNFDSGNEGIRPYDTQKVPTFIFYKSGKEIGRIIEKPEESLEKDILKIHGI